jgi:hypothetical protein
MKPAVQINCTETVQTAGPLSFRKPKAAARFFSAAKAAKRKQKQNCNPRRMRV